jgi:glycerate kinase
VVATVIAPHSFKSSLAAQQVAIARGSDIRNALPGSRTLHFPIESGGEAAEDAAVLAAEGGEACQTEVAGAVLGRREARCALLEYERQCLAIIGLRFGATLPCQPI